MENLEATGSVSLGSQEDHRHRGDHRDRHVWDVIVVGAGAAGSVYAYELTRAGLKVLLLELGQHFTDHKAQFVENEARMFERLWTFPDTKFEGGAFSGGPNLGRGVGGGTLVWAAVSLRFFHHDFRMRSLFGRPEGTTVEDWPITLSTLEPYYTEAERQLGVSGVVAPWDPPTRVAPPNPPHPLYPGSKLLQRSMEGLGIRSAPAPVAITSVKRGEREACVHCGHCRSGCRIDSKYQADNVLIKPALATGRLKLVTGAVVTRINQGAVRDTVSGVTYVDTADGTQHTVRGHAVVVANNPVEIPRLMFNSRNRFFPQGLGNEYDNVGRNFFCRPVIMLVGITNECLDTSIGYTMGNIITLDFARTRRSSGHVGGYMITTLNGANSSAVSVTPYRTMLGKALKRGMSNYNNSLVTSVICEGMPTRDGRIVVDRDSVDAYGRPMAKVSYQWHPNDLKVLESGVATTRKILEGAGAHTVVVPPSPSETHPSGSMRMGRNPRTSVTDEFGRVHGLKNVYVGGSAVFVTGSSVNPTLTIHAMALRSARHIAACFRLRDAGALGQHRAP